MSNVYINQTVYLLLLFSHKLIYNIFYYVTYTHFLASNSIIRIKLKVNDRKAIRKNFSDQKNFAIKSE